MGRLVGYKNCERSQNQVRRSGDSISDKYKGLRSKGLKHGVQEDQLQEVG